MNDNNQINGNVNNQPNANMNSQIPPINNSNVNQNANTFINQPNTLNSNVNSSINGAINDQVNGNTNNQINNNGYNSTNYINNNLNNNITNQMNNQNMSNNVQPVNNKKKFNWKLIVTIVAIVAVIFIAIKIFGKGSSSATGTSVLPQSSSSYEKVCVTQLNSKNNNEVLADMTFGIYSKNGQILQDNVIIWNVENVRNMDNSYIAGITDESDLIGKFGTMTLYYIDFGGTKSNENNYYNNEKVYITNTITYDSSEYSTVDAVISDLESLGISCK